MSADNSTGPLQLPMDAGGLPFDALFKTIYGELKQTASRVRHTYHEHALQTTQLVHELYLRLRNGSDAHFPTKAQFFSYAARAMRSIVIDHARARVSAMNREQDLYVLNEALADDSFSPALALQMEQCMADLQKADARAAKVVELHFYLGLSLPEIAEQLETSTRTIDRDWRFARSYLHAQLSGANKPA
jgi:RNA polymerase sigma factor (TIGR02999 family)